MFKLVWNLRTFLHLCLYLSITLTPDGSSVDGLLWAQV